MADNGMIFGAFVPQGWKMELVSITDPQEKWAKAVEVAVLAEELGYDSVWVYDHFHNVPVPAHEAMFECWTTLAAISQRTSRVRLGQMVGCAPYRNPGLLAKITSNIDVMSRRPARLGHRRGLVRARVRRLRLRVPAAKDRIAVLRETVEIVKSMWHEADTHYDGKFFQLRGAQCDPKPVQQPHPPIWIGGGGEQLTLRVVARHADRSNFGGKPEEFAHKTEVLQEHCKAVGPRLRRDQEDVVARSVRARDRAGSHRRREPQLLGRAVRLVARRQSRRHARAGLGEAGGVSGARVLRRRAVVRGLPGNRDPDGCSARK